MGKLAAICAVLSFIFIQFSHGAVMEDEHVHLNSGTIGSNHSHQVPDEQHNSGSQHNSAHDYHNSVHDLHNIVLFDGYLTPVIILPEGDCLSPIFDLHLGLSLLPPVPPPLS